MPEVGIKIRADGARHACDQLITVSSAINGIGKAAAQYFAPSAIGMMVAGLARKTFNYAASMGDLQGRVKVAGATLQAWGYAAQQSGGNLQDVVKAYEALGRAMGKMQGGDKEIKGAFAGLGISDLSNQEQVFYALARRIQEGGLSMKQLLDLTKLMGRNVAALFPMFEEGFVDLQQHFKDLGLAIKDDVVDAIKEADDALTDLKYKFYSDMAPAESWFIARAKETWTFTKGLLAAGGRAYGAAYKTGLQGLRKGDSVTNVLKNTLREGLEGYKAGWTDTIDEVVKENAASAIKRAARKGKNTPPNADVLDSEKVKDATKSAGGMSSTQTVDALARIGLQRGGIDPTVSAHRDMLALRQQVTTLTGHVAKMDVALTRIIGMDLS